MDIMDRGQGWWMAGGLCRMQLIELRIEVEHTLICNLWANGRTYRHMSNSIGHCNVREMTLLHIDSPAPHTISTRGS
jgi:hypothetical protein